MHAKTIYQNDDIFWLTHFIAENIPPIIETLPYGLNLKLIAEKRGSVRVGNPVLYRQIKVGTVIGIGLADTADKVNIFININKHFMALVTTKSRFWNTSGISIKGGLIKGIDIHSESVETLLSGGIAFATPENKNKQAKGGQSTNGNEFYLFEEPEQDYQNISKQQSEFLDEAMERRPEVNTLATLQKKSDKPTLHPASLCLDCSDQIAKQCNTKRLVDGICAKNLSKLHPEAQTWSQLACTFA